MGYVARCQRRRSFGSLGAPSETLDLCVAARQETLPLLQLHLLPWHTSTGRNADNAIVRGEDRGYMTAGDLNMLTNLAERAVQRSGQIHFVVQGLADAQARPRDSIWVRTCSTMSVVRRWWATRLCCSSSTGNVHPLDDLDAQA